MPVATVAPGTGLLDLTITEAARKIERGEVSPLALTESALERIATVNPKVNAYITVCDEQAREAAFAEEHMIRDGYYLGPHHGITIVLMDNVYSCEIRTN